MDVQAESIVMIDERNFGTC